MCLITGMTSATSLMKRIREKQTSDDAMLRGLDLNTDNWIQIPQPVQDVLMSIDDKLRSLDTFSYTLKLARLDFSLDQLVRRMENIETKLGRLETKFDVRMEKVEEVVISKDIKEEFSNEHLSRRMETLNEKINNKAAFLEAKLEIKMERISGKIELLERDLHNAADDIMEKLIKTDERQTVLGNEILKKAEVFDDFQSSMNELRLYFKEELVDKALTKMGELHSHLTSVGNDVKNNGDKIDLLHNTIQNNFSATAEQMKEKFQNMSGKIDGLSETCNTEDRWRSITEISDSDKCNENTHEQLDNLTAILQKVLYVGEAKFRELDNDVELYSRKVINGIQELWKTSDELKLDLSNTLEQGNKTRELVRQEFRKLHEQIEPLPKLEPKLSDISKDLDKKVVELSTTVDNSFATLLVAQNTFIASCRRIQEEEMHIYDILQQIVYEMRNRSITDIHRISSELQTQSQQINESLAQVLSTLLVVVNSTNGALQDLLLQSRQKDKCIIVTDDINWRLVDSLCQSRPPDFPPGSQDEISDLLTDDNYPEIMDSLLQHQTGELRTNDGELLINNTQRERQETENSTSTISEYDSDYQQNDNDYTDTVTD